MHAGVNMARDQRDNYYYNAKKDGYRSRASYKLKQINTKFEIISKGHTVVDLGAAPGGWLQVAKELSGGIVVGVDLQRIAPIDGVQTIRGDITKDETVEKIREIVKEADVVLCDAAPNLTGNWNVDHGRSIELCGMALDCACKILKPSGRFVVKVFEGDMFKKYFDTVKRHFSFVKAYSPHASRDASAEIYIIATKFLNTPVRRGDVMDVEIEKKGEQGDGVVMVDGFCVFVIGAEPGDRVRIKIKDVKQHFAFADII